MSLTVGTDSYISVADADTYFNNVLFADTWTTSDPAAKEKALRMATRKIDALMLRGRKVDPEQTLQFPRSLYSDTQLMNYPRWVDEEGITTEVKNATCEEAISIIKGGVQAQQRAELQRQGVTSFSLGSLSEAYSGALATPNKLLSNEAAQLLLKYTGGSRTIS